MALITARVLIGFLVKLVKSQIEVVVVYETSGMTENLSFLLTFFNRDSSHVRFKNCLGKILAKTLDQSIVFGARFLVGLLNFCLLILLYMPLQILEERSEAAAFVGTEHAHKS